MKQLREKISTMSKGIVVLQAECKGTKKTCANAISVSLALWQGKNIGYAAQTLRLACAREGKN
ncbi:hypothetical protein, partial [uncultured Desulfovibrio sp.]|uniref:hypothetical protein n=1 Tax=uncultured Desulfovibrio sp. TaxID=167968 RepID=UPI0026DA8F6E